MIRVWPALRAVILVTLVVLVGNVEAGPSTIEFTGLALNGEYLYQAGEFHQRLIVLDNSIAIAQADFFPPDDWPCIWIKSSLSSLRDQIWQSMQTIDYCGGIGWRHWIVEPQCCEWHKWVVEIGLPGQVEPTDALEFFVRRGQ